MPKLAHGTIISPEQEAAASLEMIIPGSSPAPAVSAASPVSGPVLTPEPSSHAATLIAPRFDYLFDDLQSDPSNLLPQARATVRALKQLGSQMFDINNTTPGSTIPAIYTYFGQFVDHDITLLNIEEKEIANLAASALAPLSLEQIRKKIHNGRSVQFALDTVYNYPAPCLGQEMVINCVDTSDATPERRPYATADNFNDLPRRPCSSNARQDREALVGDSRNDENLIIAQLHVAFLHAHNAIVNWLKDKSESDKFDRARTLLRQYYQWIVVEEFLPQVAKPEIVARVRDEGNSLFDPVAEPGFVPLEFAVAAYRFGHSMVRPIYSYNINFPNAPLNALFTFTALSGDMGVGKGTPTLPQKWIIEWERFLKVDGNGNAARRLGTTLARPLALLPDVQGHLLPHPEEAKLAIRNLLRGYQLRMPTGQAVARRLGFQPLSTDNLLAAAGNDAQRTTLQETGFLERTPLWYYILAEAAHEGGNRLGTIGSTLVAEVLIGLIRRSPDSIYSPPDPKPKCPAGPLANPTLRDLLRFAGVLPAPPAPNPPSTRPRA